ncbi:hypothetical protein OG563_37380 [Nocardia vinacea]|uniref:Uncharacterized protein n=1 Tax=Nocardia vinacea TaxID=96468 RepID=A0ABZ1YNE3_9NOCA|nr:hypothetical protein [Nocardia vinacea]
MTRHLASPAEIPGKDLLLMACRGMPLDTAHPMLDTAAELTEIHTTLEVTAVRDAEQLAWRRMRLIRSIDTWVLDTVSGNPATPGFGPLLDGSLPNTAVIADTDDGALAAGCYLCDGTEGLDDAGRQTAAILRYNHSMAYVVEVMAWESVYRASHSAE